MKSGTYYEWLCTKCGYFPQMEINGVSDENVKKVMLQKIEQHQIKHVTPEATASERKR